MHPFLCILTTYVSATLCRFVIIFITENFDSHACLNVENCFIECMFWNIDFQFALRLQVQAGRKLVPTALGISLIRGYQCIDPDLCLPDIRSFIEQQITLVAKGQVDHSRVVEHVLQQFKQKFIYFVKQVIEFIDFVPAYSCHLLKIINSFPCLRKKRKKKKKGHERLHHISVKF